ncbi:Signal transduction histidine kinase [Butyrivibrio sp. ob235]|uniref:HAMP domain-containing sensor histidine kinase n=1 Tax=Butyrivibrio sp. ob235 TaxID=1761780 RepID=UPI0008D63128|nr:HAMP domain-containing sensor histidine kinase [Butyrivibrio sp. ob235]SEM30818.1 Signal transduction histidine kinase [Butyrivibrio sp. ob235]
MRLRYKRKLQTFLILILAYVFLLILFLDKIKDFLTGVINNIYDNQGVPNDLSTQITLASMIVTYLLFWFLSNILEKNISDPARKIADNMNLVSSGNLDVQMEVKDSFEFAEMEEAFNNMVLKLKEAQNIREQNEEQNRQLYAGIAHDLKTPMTMVMGYARLLKEKDIPEDERNHYLTIIEQQIRAANVQLEDMLEYAKYGSTDYKIFPEEGNISGLLRGILADMFYRFEDRKIILEPDIPDKVICSYDTEQMKRIFTNLINNAIRHNPENTTLKISVKEENDVVISFSDNGPFLQDDLKDHIFEPYKKGKSGGSGLGLSVAKRIAELHGGSLEYIENTDDGYKSFVVTLPLKKDLER